jgi:hypothetical protein
VIRLGPWLIRPTVVARRLHTSYEKKDVKKKSIPAPLGDAGVVTYIQPRPIPHLILRGVIGFVALARRVFQRPCQPQFDFREVDQFSALLGTSRHF